MIHSFNLALRFFLEIAALLAVGYWGFRLPYGILMQFITGVGLPLLLAAIWATFRVPGDGGEPIVAISGQLRLVLESAVFCIAIAALFGSGQRSLAFAFAVVLIVHYGVDYERTLSLLRGTLPSG